MSVNLDRTTDSLVLDNQYVGKVVGNILDQYDSATYNLKLYFKSSLNPDSIALRDGDLSCSADEERKNEGSGTPVQQTIPNEIIVLAQTGVTGATIDNLQIQHVQQGSSTPLTVSFTITEPGSISLMDQMVASKKKLRLGATATVLYLDVLFRGLRSDETDNDAAGEPVIIAGPYTYRISNITYSMNINEHGAVYEFSGTLTEEIGKTDEYYRIPGEIETTGITISEHVEKYVSAFNALKKKVAVAFNGPDEIVIDLGALLEGHGATGRNAEYVIKDTLLTDLSKSENINRVLNSESTGTYELSAEYSETQQGVETGDTINIPTSIKILMKAGSTVEDFIGTLLSMNDDFFQKSTRVINAGDPESMTVNKNQTFVHWFRIATDVEYLEYDTTRRAYRKRIYFKPTIYREGKANIGLVQQEFDPLSKEQTNRRVAELGLYKAYEYMFTGRNDQVLGFEMNIKEAFMLELLLPDFGDFSASASSALAPSLQPSENNDGFTQGLAQRFASAQESVNRFELLRNIVENFGSLLGLTDEIIKEIQTNANSAAANALAKALSNKQLASILANAELRQRDYINQFGVITESDLSNIITGIDGVSKYVPESSGVTYSSELVSGLEGDIADTGDAISGLREAVVGGLQDVRGGVNPFADPHQQTLTMAQPINKISGTATYERGTLRNTAFSHLMNQHTALSASFMELSLEIRGDPWYIGKETYRVPTRPAGQNEAETDEEGVIWDKGTNQLFIAIAAPKSFDFDTADEDSNSGLYDFGGLNFMLSGVYDILTCTSHFTGGQFTQSLRCTKHPISTEHLSYVKDEGTNNDG